MPVIEIYSAQIDGQNCSGMLYSFAPISAVAHEAFRILPRQKLRVQTPEGYVLEAVTNLSMYGDDGYGSEEMLFDPHETDKGRDGGRVYMRAARVVNCLGRPDSEFCRIG